MKRRIGIVLMRFSIVWVTVYALLSIHFSPLFIAEQAGANAGNFQKSSSVLDFFLPQQAFANANSTPTASGGGLVGFSNNIPQLPYSISGYDQNEVYDKVSIAIGGVLMLLSGAYGLLLTVHNYRSWQTSLKAFRISYFIFIGATIAYLASEIFFIVSYKNITMKTLNDLKTDQSIGDQITYVKKMKENVESFKDAVKGKLIGTGVAMGLYFVAAIVAIIDLVNYSKAKVVNPAFIESIESGESSTDDAVDAIVPANNSVIATSAGASMGISGAAIAALLTAAAGVGLGVGISKGMSADAGGSVAPTPNTSTTSSILKEQASASNGEKSNGSSNSEIFTAEISTFCVSLGIGMIVAFLLLKTYSKIPPFNCYREGSVNSLARGCGPGSRSIVFTVFGLIASALFAIIYKKMNSLDDRIKYLGRIEKALSDLKTASSTTRLELDTKEQINNEIKQLSDYPFEERMRKVMKGTCIDTTTNRPVFDKRCDCKNSQKGCSSLGSFLNNNNKSFNFPSQVTSALPDYAKGLNFMQTGGASSTGTISLNSLVVRAADFRKLGKEYQKKLNEQLLKEGKTPIDFPKEEAKLYNKLRNGVKSMFNKLPPAEANKIISDIANSTVGGAADLENKSTTATTAKTDDKSSNKSSATAGTGGNPTGEENSFKLDDDGAGGETTADASNSDNKNATTATKEEVIHNLDEYENSHSDINKNSNESLFKIISARYVKSVFPRFLEEENPAKK